MAKLIKIEAKNFLKLKAVVIEPNGKTVVLGGKNESGKTSIIEIVKAVLGGAKMAPAEPLRMGTKKGMIALDIGEDFKLGNVRFARSVGPKGLGELKITSDEGVVLGGSQTTAKKLWRSLTFDPMVFDAATKSKPKEAAEMLRSMVGLDVATEEGQEAKLRAKRTEVGSKARNLRGLAEGLPCHDDAPGSETSVAELVDELERRRSMNASNFECRKVLEGLNTDGRGAAQRVAALRVELENAEAELEQMRAAGKTMATEVNGLCDLDDDETRAQIENAEDNNRKVRENQAGDAAGAAASAAESEYSNLTDEIEQVMAAIATKTGAVQYPIDGLEVTADEVRLDGHPWAQASMSRRIKASVAIGFAQQPELRLLLIEAGAYLDEDNLRLVAELAEAAGGIAIIEVVGEGGATVIIEDGEVKPIAEKAVA